MKTLFLILFSTLLLSKQYPTFSQQELSLLKSKNLKAYNRILHYTDTLQNLQGVSKERQLTKLNLYLNGLLAQYDMVTQGQEESWATPKEFLTLGFGDCEDYALIKYYSLIKLGFDEKKLYITIVTEKFKNSRHMVLAYFQKAGDSPLILDNLSFKILPLRKRSDLQAEYFINSSGVYVMKKNGSLRKIAKEFDLFEALRKRVAKNL